MKLFISLVLATTATLALATSNVCNTGIYTLLQPLKDYAPAEQWCTAHFPPATVTLSQGFRARRSASTKTSSSSSGSGKSSSSTTSSKTGATTSTTARQSSTTVSTTTKTSDPRASLLSSLGVVAREIASTVCSCIEAHSTITITSSHTSRSSTTSSTIRSSTTASVTTTSSTTASTTTSTTASTTSSLSSSTTTTSLDLPIITSFTTATTTISAPVCGAFNDACLGMGDPARASVTTQCCSGLACEISNNAFYGYLDDGTPAIGTCVQCIPGGMVCKFDSDCCDNFCDTEGDYPTCGYR